MKQCMILTIGVPGCGKSTWAGKLCARKTQFVEVNRDKLRRSIGKFSPNEKIQSTKELEGRVTSAHRMEIFNALSNGHSVVVSDTNINPDTRADLERVAKDFQVPIFYKHFKESTDYDVLMHRNATRPEVDRVPNKVVRDFYIRYREQNFKKAKKDPTKWIGYIFDIDGTLADHTGLRSPYDWKSVGKDRCFEDVATMARTLHESGYAIIMLSGRDGSCRQETIDWLDENQIPFHELHMRPAGNSMKDSIVKYDLFKEFVEPNYDIFGVFDDRQQVVDMWREIGLRCFQCAPGQF